MSNVAAMIRVAEAAVDETYLLATTNGRLAEIAPAAALAKKALADAAITEADLDSVSAQLAHKVRDILGL